MKVLVYIDNGELRVIHPVYATKGEEEAEADFLTRVGEKAAPGIPKTVMDKAALPQDRSFRNAWTLSGGSIGMDMGKAREVHKENIRSARLEELKVIDADDTLNETQARNAKKSLEDLTTSPAITTAQTPDDLKAAWPSALAARNPYV